MRRERIDRAIRKCVKIALQGPKTPLTALATSLDELRRDPAWRSSEVRQVQAQVFRRLNLETARYSQLERA